MVSHNLPHKDPFMSKTRIAFVGAGNMAASLIGGLRAQGVDAALICASAPGAETRERIANDHGIQVFADNAEAIKGADVVVLAVKPQMMKNVCQALKSSLEANQLIVSVAAGITCASLTQWQDSYCLRRCRKHGCQPDRRPARPRRGRGTDLCQRAGCRNPRTHRQRSWHPGICRQRRGDQGRRCRGAGGQAADDEKRLPGVEVQH
ncbi:hypothetical protein BKM09_016055 [Pseudomonas amygdali pv. morsprunorum]|nr:hypothetical protein BKM09_016055 [Pseudomonas amygdali pv. morsprunorum]